MQNRFAEWCVFMAITFAATACGCGRSGPERATISGKVTFRSEPIRFGEIRFIPAAANEGSTEGTPIVDGHYNANGKGGVPVGDYSVSIVAWQSPAPRRNIPASGGPSGSKTGETSRRQLLPAKYNSQSELKLTVKSGSGSIVQDYSLTD
jgi:hypothetical protein